MTTENGAAFGLQHDAPKESVILLKHAACAIGVAIATACAGQDAIGTGGGAGTGNDAASMREVRAVTSGNDANADLPAEDAGAGGGRDVFTGDPDGPRVEEAHDAALKADSASPPLIAVNFDGAGKQILRRDTTGKQLDAHDGGLAHGGSLYYLYGTTYGCGFEWRKVGAPFCGFRVYSSPDLVTWTDRGLLFDPTTATWQQRCNGSTYGCFRPRVVYNSTSKKYVLWINSYDNVSGFHVLDSEGPVGPFVEIAEPQLAVNQSAASGGLNNGDENLFVDDDGKAYLVFTDWRSDGDIVVEELDSLYHSGTGRFVRLMQTKTEAPALFHRGTYYYLTYSDPNCGYCAGTGTSYKRAPSPLGPWQGGSKISDKSCGGQPSHVAVLPGRIAPVYVYQSDLWLDGSPKEAAANLFWGPLAFDTGGQIQPLDCAASVELN